MTVALPYRTPSEAAVQAGAWQLVGRDGHREPVPPLLPDWDCGTDLRFAREIVVDRPLFAERAGLDQDDMSLQLVVQWRASDSALSGLAYRAAITATSTTVAAEFILPGRNLSGTLTLATAIILSRPPARSSGPVARHVGSILWRDSPKKVRLTGDASRLPVAVVDFKALHLEERAPWSVRIEGSLDSPAMGAIQLLLNSRRTDVVELVESSSASSPASAAVRSALYVAVGRALVEYAIAEEELTADDVYEEGSLGAVLLGQLRLRFPERSLTDLRALRENEPLAFSTLLDGRFGLFEGVAA